MQYKIIELRVKNFKCFDNSKFFEFRIDYDKNPIILSGPNGFGKTTFFDAIELIFSNNITRLDTAIERKNTNLGKNILLNKVDEDGFVVLTLKNEIDQYVTLFAKILNSIHKIEIDKALVFGAINKKVATEDLAFFLEGYKDWKENLQNQEFIKYQANHFNVYYYVSQAESVHFLKKTITERKDAMNVLLDTEDIENRKSRVVELIGKKSDAKGVIINDEIASLDIDIYKKLAKLKSVLKESGSVENTSSKYVSLGLYEENNDLFYWDNSNLSEYSTNEIRNGIRFINRINSYIQNESDFKNYTWNKELEEILENNAIDDYIDYSEYLLRNKVSNDFVKKDIEQLDLVIKIYNNSLFFRTEPIDIKKYKKEDLKNLSSFIPELSDFDFSLINNIVDEINSLYSTLSTNQLIIDKLKNARKTLQLVSMEYDDNINICPFCNTKFENSKSLKDSFIEVDEMLIKGSGNTLERIKNKNIELIKSINNIKEIVLALIQGEDDNSIKILLKKKAQLQKFINDVGRVQNVEKVAYYIEDTSEDTQLEKEQMKQKVRVRQLIDNDGFVHNVEEVVYYHKKTSKDTQLEKGQMKLEIQRKISGMNKKIVNPEFGDLNQKNMYKEIYDKFYEQLGNIRKAFSLFEIEKKIEYLNKFIIERECDEIQSIRNEIRENIKHKAKLERVRSQLDTLQKRYDAAINDYKNRILKKLRVPILIYTGKILQDYQNGLGVFINKDEMRFVSNGKAKHDILNTFSSGQLSGFVLSFLFAMNKQYIRESSDDIGFILIDDPVQTMDDINIASLIEVLRNDFANKQIILSTHESDKENYILYKFYKYNQIGQSFNVKEEIYGV